MGRQEFRYDKHNGATERTVQQTWRDDGSLSERRSFGGILSEQKSPLWAQIGFGTPGVTGDIFGGEYE